MDYQECTKNGGCQTQPGMIVIDMQWRWLHDKDGYTNCLGAQDWDPALCPDRKTCARNCAIEGLTPDDYSQTYGINQMDGGVKLNYVAPKGNVASRLYLLQDDDNYKMFKLKNREFSVTTDVSSLGCGLNGAIYFVEMPQDGGKDGDLNQAGAKYGTGYCDAQCPRGMKFIKGRADTTNWQKIDVVTPELEHKMVGPVGKYGACCAEMDLFEANKMAASYTAHPCSFQGTLRCKGDEECGNKRLGYLSECDKNGCAMNSYQLGEHDFYGEGKKVDSTKPITLVTQFITSDGTDNGDLVEIRRLYIQDDEVIQNTKAQNVPNFKGADSVKDDFCKAMAKEYNESLEYNFENVGGLKAMGEALDRGMVLTLSIWDDALTRMLWLDGEKGAIDKDPNFPGVTRGPCAFKSGVAKELHETDKDAYVTFTDIKVGEIGSTYDSSATPAKKYVLTDAAKNLASGSGGLPLGIAAAALGVVGAGALMLSMVVRTNRLRQLSPRILEDEAAE